MSKIDKMKESIKQGKKYVVISLILWVILSIVFVAPIATSWALAQEQGADVLTNFIENLIKEIVSFTSFFKMFGTKGALRVFGKCLIPYTIAFILFALKGFSKTKPKGKYHDIEHGSSDWSKGGEQYKVLSKDKGIILAENNYLPIDKRGNINTLIVGRFRFW